MPSNDTNFEKLNQLIINLHKETNKTTMLKIGLELANEVMMIFGIPEKDLDIGDDELDKALPNSSFHNQKMETWFEKHPYMGSARVALKHYDKNTYPIESMFFELSDTPRKEKIAAATHLFPHWEDSDLTMIPKYNVGIDFFLSPKTKSMLIVISKGTNLRVMELCEHLSNTQREVFAKCRNIALYDGIDPKTNTKIKIEPQHTIHSTLWNAFELKEVNKKFYSGIAYHFQLLCQHLVKNPPEGTKNTIKESAKIFGSRLIGRLLFIWFLKKKGIINEKMDYFSPEKLSSSDYYSQKLKVLFFNTLNTPINLRNPNSDLKTPYLNGGLFEPHTNDWPDKDISFPENWFVTLYDHLNLFNFTTDESSPDYEQVAVDPEMLGRVFENLLASIVPGATQISERSEKGAFYTPREIVDFMCKSTLKEYLNRHAESDKDYEGIEKLINLSDSDFMLQKSTGLSDLWGVRSVKVRTTLISALNNMTVLDPACGSGAFPIGMLQLIAKTYERLSAYYDASIDKMRPIKPTEHNSIYDTKLYVIRHSLYGSDIEPMAVEIARLRAWLSLIIDDKRDVDPLPNLDFNFVCSNSLIPLEDAESDGTQTLFFDMEKFDAAFDELKTKYFNAHDYESKQKLRKEFQELYSENSNINDSNKPEEIKKIAQLKTWNPFNPSKPADFFDSKKMFNIDKFDIVIGNPPYIHFNDIKEASHKIYQPLKYETYEAKGDIYCLFIEKGIKSLKEHGLLCFITSNKWMRAGYGEGLRDFLTQKANTLMLIDFGGTKVFDSATVDTNILLVGNERNQNQTLSCEIKENCLDYLSDYIKQNYSINSFTGVSPWAILSEVELSIKNKIEKKGIPLKEWNIKINYGVKTGLNDAFIIDENTKQKLIDSDPHSAEIIRPILRGRDINRYSYVFPHQYLICTFPSLGIDINQYPAVKRYLLSFGMERLEQTGKEYVINGTAIKSRKKTNNKWFETQDSISYSEELQKRKLVWTPVNSEYRFCILPEKYVFNNSLFMITGNDLEYLCGVLNSKLYQFYFYLIHSTGAYQYGSSSFMGSVKIRLKQNNLIEKIVTNIGKNNIDCEKAIIDNEVFSEYGISSEEIDYISKNIL